MQRLRLLAFAAAVLLTNLSPTAARAEPSPEAMEAAQALFTQLFAHGFIALNAQAVEIAWPGIESALRAQKPDLSGPKLAAERIRAHPPRPSVRNREGCAGDLRPLSHGR